MDYEKVKQILKNKDDLYAVLNVAKEAEIKDITRSHRRLALQLHPDKVACFSLPELAPDAPERMRKEKLDREETARAQAGDAFLAVQRAYEVLTDEKLRRVYDLGGITDVKAQEDRGEMQFPPLWKVAALISHICLGVIDPSRRFVNTPHVTKNKDGSFKKRTPPFSEWPMWSNEERRSVRPPSASPPKTFWGRMKWTAIIFVLFSIFGVAGLNNVQTKAARTSSKNLRKHYDSVASNADKLLGEIYALGRRLPSTLKETSTVALPELIIPYFTSDGLPVAPTTALVIQSHIIGELSMCAQMGYMPLDSSLASSGVTPADHLKQVIRCAQFGNSSFCARQHKSHEVLRDLLRETVGTSRASLPQQLFIAAIAPLLHLCTSPSNSASTSDASFIPIQRRLSRYSPLATHLGFISRLTVAAALEHAEQGNTLTWTNVRIKEESLLQNSLVTKMANFGELRKSNCRHVEKTKTSVNDKWGRTKVKITRQIVNCQSNY